MQRTAELIRGMIGQDSPYLVDTLRPNEYEVSGVTRRTSLLDADRIDHFFPVRGESLVTREISFTIGRTAADLQPDMPQQDEPDGFVVAIDEQYTVYESTMQLSPGSIVVRVTPRDFYPTEVQTLLCNLCRAHARLGSKPSTSLH